MAASGARAEPPSKPVELEVFVREGCPRCEDAKRFLSQLQAERSGLQVHYRDVGREPEALARLQELASQQSATLEHRTTDVGLFELNVSGSGQAKRKVWKHEAASWQQ